MNQETIENMQTFINNMVTTSSQMVDAVNNFIVKVNYVELENTIKEIENLLSGLEDYSSTCFESVLSTDAWSSKYQQIFNKHIESETLVRLRKIINDCRTYNNYLTKVISKYKKIDTYR